MAEQWKQWRPIEGLSHNYFIYEVRVTVKGFFVLLADIDNSTKGILITFGNSVSAYRSTDEGFRQKTISLLNEGGYPEDFYTKWSLFKVENSEYLDWLSQESHTLTDVLRLQHYAFITPDEIFDIAVMYEPKVEIVSNIT